MKNADEYAEELRLGYLRYFNATCDRAGLMDEEKRARAIQRMSKHIAEYVEQHPFPTNSHPGVRPAELIAIAQEEL